MSSELLDLLDETIQDLEEAGFSDAAEALYSLGYESQWPDPRAMQKEVGLELMRIESKMGGDLPATVVAGMARCIEVIRRVWPTLSLTED